MNNFQNFYLIFPICVKKDFENFLISSMIVSFAPTLLSRGSSSWFILSIINSFSYSLIKGWDRLHGSDQGCPRKSESVDFLHQPSSNDYRGYDVVDDDAGEGHGGGGLHGGGGHQG